MRSLRKRLLLDTTVAFVVVLGLLGWAVDVAVRRTLVAEFDSALLAKAQALSSMVEQHDEHVTFEFDVQDMPEFAAGARPAYFEIWVNGKRFEKSPSLQGRPLLEVAPPVVVGPQGRATREMALPDGSRGRCVMLSSAAHDFEDEHAGETKTAVVIVVAQDTRELDRTLAALRWTLVGLCLAAVAIAGAAVLVVVGRAIRPVKVVARQIADLRETALATRLDAADVPNELRPVVDRLNDLLARLEEAFARERAFTADVAHELRTPIAGLRTTLEVCRSRPRDPAAYAGAIDRSLKVIGSMQTVIENLLLLARAESRQLPMTLTDTDLVELLRDTWSVFSARAAEAGLTMNWQTPETCVLACDVGKLRIILSNLFDNAVSYADPGGALEIQLKENGGRVALQIANTGNQISEEELPHLFERFWRKDAARAQTGVHAGLGLSLCQRLLALSEATIHVRTKKGSATESGTAGEGGSALATPPHWFIIELILPGPVQTYATV